MNRKAVLFFAFGAGIGFSFLFGQATANKEEPKIHKVLRAEKLEIVKDGKVHIDLSVLHYDTTKWESDGVKHEIKAHDGAFLQVGAYSNRYGHILISPLSIKLFDKERFNGHWTTLSNGSLLLTAEYSDTKVGYTTIRAGQQIQFNMDDKDKKK